ncbi:MAG: tetratricopeptide repeat protein [Planctomycetota bacterium]|jgi:Tfp pilus assembly protein PilF
MTIKAARSIFVIVTFMLAPTVFWPCGGASGAERRLGAGEQMPEFSLPDANGKVFDHKHREGKVLIVAFLSGGQKASIQAASDIQEIAGGLSSDANEFKVVFVVYEPNSGGFLQSTQKESARSFNILPDAQYKLWGTFGIMVTPTVVIGGRDDKIVLVKAGYGYDFAPALRAHLGQALGLVKDGEVEESTRVETLKNATVTARVRRHLQMAKILEQKGHFESAIAEMGRARELDPNSVAVVIELGELLCRTNQSQAALDAVDGINSAERIQKAALLLISGWAKRQMGEVDAAEKLLLKATTLDPKSSRAFFELGKVYQAKEESEKAMLAYYQALALVFGEPADRSSSHQQ